MTQIQRHKLVEATEAVVLVFYGSGPNQNLDLLWNVSFARAAANIKLKRLPSTLDATECHAVRT